MIQKTTKAKSRLGREFNGTDKENVKKAEFFNYLNEVLDNKLVKPSIIIEYVNQYQRGE